MRLGRTEYKLIFDFLYRFRSALCLQDLTPAGIKMGYLTSNRAKRYKTINDAVRMNANVEEEYIRYGRGLVHWTRPGETMKACRVYYGSGRVNDEKRVTCPDCVHEISMHEIRDFLDATE